MSGLKMRSGFLTGTRDLLGSAEKLRIRSGRDRVNYLLADTEAGENTPQQSIGGKLAGDFAEAVLCLAQVLR